MKKKYSLFGIILILFLGIISFDLYYLLKIKELREEKAVNTNLIQETVDIQNKWFVQISKMDGYTLNKDSEEIRFFDSRGKIVEKNKFLEELDIKLNELILTKIKSTTLVLNPLILKQLYNDIINESRSVIRSLKILNKKIDKDIADNLYNNTVLVFIILALVLIIFVMLAIQLKKGYAFFKLVKIHDLLLKNSIDFILITNKDTEIIGFNSAAQKAFGYSLEEVKNLKRDILFKNPADANMLTKTLSETGEFKGEIINKRKNGEIFTSYLSANTIYNKKGKRVGTMGISRDISKEKEVLLRLENQSKEINQSIAYASRLQKATLPSIEYIEKIFPESFVFYEPKESLSGDFYLIENILTKSGEELQFLIVADCTGHGVPGAILSTLCNGLIKESLLPGTCNSTSEILEFVRTRIIEFFYSKKDKNIWDGMDAAVCMFDKKNRQMHFSGANCSCYFIRNTEIQELCSTKQSVSYSDNPVPFISEKIDLQDGDCFYLATDGFVDQFGGNSNKKFMKKQFKELLLANHEEKMSVQGEKIESAFNDWKQSNDQTDDVLVFGLKWSNEKSFKT